MEAKVYDLAGRWEKEVVKEQEAKLSPQGNLLQKLIQILLTIPKLEEKY